MAARCGFGHRRRVVFAGRRRAVAPVLQQPRRLLSVTGSTLAWAQRAAASSAAAPGVSLLAARLMDELVSARGAACGRLPVGACPGQAGGRATVGLRVTGQSTIGSSQTAESAGGGTRGYIPWMADAIWILGPPSLGGLGRACGRGRRCDRPDRLVRRRRFRRWRLLAHGWLGGVRRLLTGPN
jgi:hypothetical protein